MQKQSPIAKLYFKIQTFTYKLTPTKMKSNKPDQNANNLRAFEDHD